MKPHEFIACTGRFILALGLAIGSIALAMALPGCRGSGVSKEAAAFVNGRPITEGEIAACEQAYRQQVGAIADETWNDWLEKTGTTPESLRTEIISGLVEDECLLLYAEENGLVASEEEVNAALAAGDVGTGLWRLRLEEIRGDEDRYRSMVKDYLTLDKVSREAIKIEEVSDEELLELAIAKSAALGIEIPEEGLSSIGQLSVSEQKSLKSAAEQAQRAEAMERFIQELVSETEVEVR